MMPHVSIFYIDGRTAYPPLPSIRTPIKPTNPQPAQLMCKLTLPVSVDAASTIPVCAAVLVALKNRGRSGRCRLHSTSATCKLRVLTDTAGLPRRERGAQRHLPIQGVRRYLLVWEQRCCVGFWDAVTSEGGSEHKRVPVGEILHLGMYLEVGGDEEEEVWVMRRG